MHFQHFQFGSQRSQSVCLLLFISSRSALLFCFSFPKRGEYCQGILTLTHLVLSRDAACFGSCSVFLRHINQVGLAENCEHLLKEESSLPYLLSHSFFPLNKTFERSQATCTTPQLNSQLQQEELLLNKADVAKVSL